MPSSYSFPRLCLPYSLCVRLSLECCNKECSGATLTRQPAALLCCSAVANLAVALLSLEESERRLLDFLARARTPLGKPLFDAKYALRLAKERNRCGGRMLLLWRSAYNTYLSSPV